VELNDNLFFRELLNHVEYRCWLQEGDDLSRLPEFDSKNPVYKHQTGKTFFTPYLNEKWASQNFASLIVSSQQVSVLKRMSNRTVLFEGCNESESAMVEHMLLKTAEDLQANIFPYVVNKSEYVKVPKSYIEALDGLLIFDVRDVLKNLDCIDMDEYVTIKLQAVKSREAKEKAEIRHNLTTRPLKAKAIELAEEVRKDNPSQSLRSIAKQLHPKIKNYAKSEGLPYSTDDPYGTIYKWLREHFKA